MVSNQVTKLLYNIGENSQSKKHPTVWEKILSTCHLTGDYSSKYIMISKIKEQKNKSSSQYVGKWTEDCSLRRVQIWINTLKNVQYLAIKEMQTKTRRRIRLWWLKFVISSDTRRLTKFKANVRPFFKKTKNQTKVILVFHIDLVRVAII